MILANRLMMNMPVFGGNGGEIPYPKDGLAYCFLFEDDSDNFIKNSVSDSIDGQKSDSSVVSVDGAIGKAIAFNGNNFAFIDNKQRFDEFSISFWVKSRPNKGTYIAATNSWVNSWFFEVDALNYIEFQLANSNGSFLRTSCGKFSSNEFVHILITKSANKVVTYNNGIKVSENSTNSSHFWNMHAFSLGAMASSPSSANYHSNCSIDEFLIYNRAITDEEIKQIYEYRG